MKKNTSKLKSKGFNKGWSIAILTIFVILMILGIVFAFVPLDNGQLGVTDYKNFASNIKLGLDLKGGTSALYNVDYEDFLKKYEGDTSDEQQVLYDFDASIAGTVKNLETLLTKKGYTESQISISGSGKTQQIRIEVPDVESDEFLELLAEPTVLTMYEANMTGNSFEATGELLLDGKDIRTATVGMKDGKYIIQLKFTKKGTEKFKEATTNLVGKRIGIFLDGQPLIAPEVESVINTGQAIITGDYELDEAEELATQIQAGSFNVTLKLDSLNDVSATLGQNAITHGLIAGGVGLLIIFIIMIARYRLLGVAASLSLIFFALTYVFILSIFPWVQLTLPGIAGILLSIGMAVDANVIIFERIRELMRGNNERDIRSSIKQGFKNSLSAIIDGNVTTLIGAIVLAIIAASAIKGFAITLLIGILISLVSSLLICRLLIKCFLTFNDNSNALYGLNVKEVDYSIDYKNAKKDKLSAPSADNALAKDSESKSEVEKSNAMEVNS